MLGVGELFPSFDLKAIVDKKIVNLTDKDFGGKWKVVFFWPKDFTFVCPTEIVGFGDLVVEFQKRNTQILGCSIDSEYVHMAWQENHPQLKDTKFPWLSDIKRELSQSLGILDKNAGVAQRATFIVDLDGKIRFVYVSDLAIGRNPQEVLRVLDALQTGELCGCGWSPGKITIKV